MTQGGPGQQDPLLRALHLPERVPVLQDGLRVGALLGPLPDRRRPDGAHLPAARRWVHYEMVDRERTAAPDAARARRAAAPAPVAAQARPARPLLYALVVVLTVVMLLPLYWMIVTALTPSGQGVRLPAEADPVDARVGELQDAPSRRSPSGPSIGNSFLYAVTRPSGCLITESMVGYGFARFRFPGRNVLFGICLATMMLPFVVTVIPRFLLFRNLGLFDTLWPLIIPWWFGGTPFGIFLFRQFFRGCRASSTRRRRSTARALPHLVVGRRSRSPGRSSRPRRSSTSSGSGTTSSARSST